MSTVIQTTAPISIDELKKYFVDNSITYSIDYSNSTLKGNKLLVYLGNLNLPCNLDVEFNDEFLELLKDYFNCKILVSIPVLEICAIEVLFFYRFGRPETEGKMFSNKVLEKFIEENKEIIERWAKILDSLTLYNMFAVNCSEFNEFVKEHPEDLSDDITGINFVNLLKYQEFYLFYSDINREWLTYYKAYFNEYMFKGKNLYHYWATDNNPLFLLTFAIVSNSITPDDLKKTYESEKEEV